MGVVQGKSPSKGVLITFFVVMVFLCVVAAKALSGSGTVPVSAPTVADGSSSDSSGSSSVPISTGPTLHAMNEPADKGNFEFVVTGFKSVFGSAERGRMSYTARHEYHLSKQPL
jgi:hypothetical protein